MAYNAEHDADALMRAMKGLGTDDATLIATLTGRKRKHLQEVKSVFEKKYGKSLESWIKSETSGTYEDLLIAIIDNRNDYNAKVVYNAIKGIGTNEDALIEILCTKTNQELRDIAASFHRLFGKDMKTEVHQDLSGDLQKLFDVVLLATRDEVNQDKEIAKQEAQFLHSRGEKKIGTDEEAFIRIFAQRSRQQVQLIDMAYADLTGHNLEHAIKSETSGYFQKALLALKQTPVEFWVSHFHDCVKGTGTKDQGIVRGVGSHNKKQLKEINNAYTQKYGHSLIEDLKNDTSGDFRKTLLSIIPHNL